MNKTYYKHVQVYYANKWKKTAVCTLLTVS